jgi:hypothetical protein
MNIGRDNDARDDYHHLKRLVHQGGLVFVLRFAA